MEPEEEEEVGGAHVDLVSIRGKCETCAAEEEEGAEQSLFSHAHLRHLLRTDHIALHVVCDAKKSRFHYMGSAQ